MNFIKKKMMNYKNSNYKEGHRYDPRPDIKQDHQLWQLLLKEAEKIDRQLFGNLHGFRCVGARLQLKNNKLELESKTDFFENKTELEEYKKEFLFPFRSEIIDLLKEIGEIT